MIEISSFEGLVFFRSLRADGKREPEEEMSRRHRAIPARQRE
jgi:hypothetical protein